MYELIATELFNRPHLVEAGRLDAMSAYVMSRQGFDIQVPDQPKPMAFVPSDTAVLSDNGYYLDGGVAIINMIGTMVNRAGFMQAMSGVVGYTSLSRRFKRAMNDPQVKAIFINGDTPGGGVSGAFDFSDLIFSARGVKPVYTLASDCLCSAGILIGSSAEKVYTTQTGQIGSIGVVMKHVDVSQQNAEAGINPTYIYAGDRKVDGNPDAPLSAQVLAMFQAEVQQLYGMFTAAMVRNTHLTEQEIIDTQAAVYLGADAVDIGLAEAVTTGDQLLEDMKSQYGTGRPYSTSTTTLEKQAMSEKEEKPNASAEDQGGTNTNADIVNETETVETDKGKRAVSGSDQTAAANKRFAAIMESDAAKGREKAAVRLATGTDMSAADVIATLEDLPVSAKDASKLDAAMEQVGKTGVTAEGGHGDTEMSDAQKILGDFNSARGKRS